MTPDEEVKQILRDLMLEARNEAIDEFSKAIKELYPLYVAAGIEFNGDFHKEIDEIAERLKGGGAK